MFHRKYNQKDSLLSATVRVNFDGYALRTSELLAASI